MRQVVVQTSLWCAVYLIICLLFLGVVLLGPVPSPRDFLVELGVGLGIVGFAMLGLQFVTTARFRWIAPYFGSDAMIHFHRQTGILTLAFLLAHPLVLFLANSAYLEYLDPRVNFLRTASLIAATVGLILLVVLPLWRLSFRLNYEWWRITHALLSGLVVLIGLAHALRVGHYVDGLAKQAFWVMATVLMVGLLLHVRIGRPLRMRRTPYRVAEVRPEHGDVYSLALEADGHAGMEFRAGQFAWITLGDTPFTLQQHPFSFSSSARERTRLEFGIKALGDFTSTIKDLRPGTRAFLEGPFGSFTLDAKAEAAAFIMGGIGITPGLGILRTCRDENDRRPLVLIYANNTWEEIAFREELDALQKQLNLKVVHVIVEPPADWQGETGLITGELLERHLAALKTKDLQYFVCGPTPMMEVVEKELVERNVPRWRLLSERFDFV